MSYTMSSGRHRQADPSETSLSEILGAFSYALDLTEGQPAGHSVRACWIAMQLGSAVGLGRDALHDIYYAVLLKDLGCSSNAARVADLFGGDDRKLKHDFKLIGPSPEEFGAFVVSEAGSSMGAGTAERGVLIDNILANAGPIMCDLIGTRCARGADVAKKLRFAGGVSGAIASLDEHWDGSGLPTGLSGDAIPLGARIALLAQIADVFFTARGGIAARCEIAKRRGGWLDPSLCDVFLEVSARSGFWEALGGADIEHRLALLAPDRECVTVDDDYLDDISAAFGQVIDAKSPYTGGHSERVGRLADGVAWQLGWSPSQRRSLRRAAILHDVGKLGVSSVILEKPGRLDELEGVQMRLHASLTTDILGRVGVMRHLANIAGAHHERLDGAGYPRNLRGADIHAETRIISVADFFDALTADRPYRKAMHVDRAFDIMSAEVDRALDSKCFAALKRLVETRKPQAA